MIVKKNGDENMKKDIVDIIIAFDSYLEYMYDRGNFDPTDPEDAKLNEFIRGMRQKYL